MHILMIVAWSERRVWIMAITLRVPASAVDSSLHCRPCPHTEEGCANGERDRCEGMRGASAVYV